MFVTSTVMAMSVKTEHAEVEIIAEKTAIIPGETAMIGLSIKHAPHWHTYWKNPGDSGYPTQIVWSLPVGYGASEIDWPTPKRLPTGPLINFGYENTVLLPVSIQVSKHAVPGQTITLTGKAEWLICKDVCIPESGDVSIALAIAMTAALGPDAPRFVAARSATPGNASNWKATLYAAPNPERSAWLRIIAPSDAVAHHQLDVFPIPEQITDPAVQQVYQLENGYAVKLRLLNNVQLPKQLPLVLAASSAITHDGRSAGEIQAMVENNAFNLPVNASTLASLSGPTNTGREVLLSTVPAANGVISQTLVSALLLAFIGGLILNLMPCVFPVLSIKILSFARQVGDSSTSSTKQGRTLKQHGLFYAAGVLLSFLLLASILLAFKSAGSTVGWGFQLQTPGVVWVLAIIFFLVGLNLAGLFEFGQWVPSSWLSTRARHSGIDAFLSGVLAVIAASPCTAPFMGAALGFALTQSALAALAVFTALGIGMALPYVLLAWFPAWLKHLPRPGAWMSSFKQLLAFPMFVTVVWLIWVLSQQVGVDGAALGMLGLVTLAFATWLTRSQHNRIRIAGLVIVIAAIVFAWPAATTTSTTTASGNDIWQSWEPDSITSLTAQGKPVFVDFTAAWCVSCQANKRFVLARDEIEQAFAAKNVTLMRADWTKRDARITAALAQLGRSGVPVYVLYVPGKAPQLLPEVLTTSIIKDALAVVN